MSIDILFLSYGGSHVHMLKDTYCILQKNASTAFLALTSAESVMQDLALDYDSLNQLVEDLPSIYQVLDQFGVKGDHSQNLYTGVGLSELESNLGTEQAAALYAELGRAVLCPRELARKILMHYQPKVVVTSNIVRLARAMFAEANQLGIKTVFVEDAFCTPSHPFENVSSEIRNVVSPDISIDYLISMSPDVIDSISDNLKRNYIVNEPEFHALGNPNIENSLDIKILNDHLVPNEKYLLFLSNKLFRDEISEFLIEFCAENSSTLLVIKIHPNETEEYYTSRFAQFSHVKVISEKTSLVPLIKSAEVVLATDTTAALEAHLLGKKIFCLNPMHSDYLMEHYVNRGISENIATCAALAKRIKEFESESAEYTPRINLTRDSVNKISTFLFDLINSNKETENE